ncbi:MAG: hypothetical protein JKX96_04425 [Acinetobacter sp.]|nr:hypothetical protein [Acinetobacter sp.]
MKRRLKILLGIALIATMVFLFLWIAKWTIIIGLFIALAWFLKSMR